MPLSLKNIALIVACSLLILLGTCLIYWPGLHGPFIFDDLTNIIAAPALHITHLDIASLREAALWQKSSSLGRPIAMLSFALNYYFTQFDPFYFKLTNLLLHLFNGIGLYLLTTLLLRRLQQAPGTSSMPSQHSMATRHRYWMGLAVATLWLVHPLNLTSVLYVVQRMTSLSAFFSIMGLLGYVIGREQLVAGKVRGFATIITSLMVGGGLATLSKENGVLLVLYMFVIEIGFYRFAAAEQLRRPLKGFWFAVFGLPLAAVVIILLVNPNSLLGLFSYQYRAFSLEERLLTEARALWFYLKLIAFPDIRQLGIYHDDFVISRGIFTPVSTVFALAGIFALFSLAVACFRRLPVLSFGILWFFAGHSLESTLIPLELVHEHRNYLPQYGILLMLVYYLTYPYARINKSLALRNGFLVLYLGLLSSITHARAGDWKDEWTLYSRDASNHPNSARAQGMLAIILHDNGQDTLATEYFTKAANLDPHDSMAMIRLTQHLYTVDRHVPPEILDELEHRLMSNPYSSITLWTFEPLLNNSLKDPALNLRFIHMYEHLIGRTDIALTNEWRAYACRTLGFTYRERGDLKNALRRFRTAIDLHPLPAFYLVSAEMYMRAGQPGQAKEMLEEMSGKALNLSGEEMQRLERIRDALKKNNDNRASRTESH
jgi:tetratricopeptide (TPR) repeat protein